MTVKLMKTDNVFSVLVIMLPFLAQYRGFGNAVSLGELSLMPFVIFYLTDIISKNRNVLININLLLIYLASLLSIIAFFINPYFSFNSYFTAAARIVFYGLLFFAGRGHFSFEKVKNVYLNFSLLMSIYTFIQYIYTSITGRYLPIYLSYSWLFPPEQRAENLDLFYRSVSYRASGLFLEPGYLALFLVPALAYVLVFDDRYTRKIIITMGMLISNSMAGILLAIICWGVSFIISRHKFSKVQIKRLLFIGGILPILLFIGARYGLLEVAWVRFWGGGSFGARITRGLQIYAQMPIINKIFGCGLNNMGEFVSGMGYTTIYDQDASAGYAASIINTLINTGILGLLSLLAFVIKLKKKMTTKFTWILYVSFISILSYEGILFTYRWAFFIFIILDIYQVNKLETKNKLFMSSSNRRYAAENPNMSKMRLLKFEGYLNENTIC